MVYKCDNCDSEAEDQGTCCGIQMAEECDGCGNIVGKCSCNLSGES